MTEKPYKSISLKRELVEAAEVIIENRPDLGFRSIAQYVEDAVRKKNEHYFEVLQSTY